MTSIHPIAYMTIGVIISAYSKFVEYKNPETFLGPFFYIGLIFLAIGLVKLMFRRMNKESKEKQEDFETKYKQAEQGFEQSKPFQNKNQQFYDNNQSNKQKDPYTGFEKY